MPRRKFGPPYKSCLLVVLILLVTASALIWMGFYVTGQAEGEFGPPAKGLSTYQHLRYALDLTLHRDELTQPFKQGAAEQPFDVKLGEPVGAIVTELSAMDLIGNPDLFREYLVYTGMDTQLQAGKYKISPALTPVQIAQALIDPTPKEVDFGVLAGWRLEEIARALPTSGLSVTPDEFLQAAHNLDLVPALKAELPAQASLEGFIFPGTVSLLRDISVGELLDRLTGRFLEQVTPEMRQGFQKQGLSLYQAVTLASMVEKEAVVPDEQPVIASVFYNRLAAGMRLESDPTVQYALGYNPSTKTWWTNPLTSDDLLVDSPYNTYAVAGMPPGPIANPSLSALQAVAEPATTGYYFFRARCDGTHLHAFAVTLDEQVQNACP
jgi:UPF0755 protein